MKKNQVNKKDTPLQLAIINDKLSYYSRHMSLPFLKVTSVLLFFSVWPLV